MDLTPEVVWRIFLATGSITAYLLYKQLAALRIHTWHWHFYCRFIAKAMKESSRSMEATGTIGHRLRAYRW